jgi:predicted ATPase
MPTSATFEVLDSYSAVELFTQRARQITANFSPSVAELADIGRICQLVEGMPLGLELAAPWIRTLSCGEIASEIERSLDFLATPLRNVPERHRSLRVVFEQSWERLSAAEQAVLGRLSVFRGGCSREAAEQVAGATLPVLSALGDKALLRRTNTGRYELHELIRQFAGAQLQINPAAVEPAQQRHQDYYIAFLEGRTAGVKGGRQKETLAEIKADLDNVRLAWRRAVAMRDSEAMARSAQCLFVYYLYRNGYDEGQSEFRRAISVFIALPQELADDGSLQEIVVPDQAENLVGFLLAGLGYFLAHRRNLQQGQRLLEQALAMLRGTEPVDRGKEAFALLWLGWALYFQGQLSAGKRYAGECLTLLTETADPWAEGWALVLLGNCLRDGRPAEAVEVYRTGLTLCRESGDQIVLS